MGTLRVVVMTLSSRPVEAESAIAGSQLWKPWQKEGGDKLGHVWGSLAGSFEVCFPTRRPMTVRYVCHVVWLSDQHNVWSEARGGRSAQDQCRV